MFKCSLVKAVITKPDDNGKKKSLGHLTTSVPLSSLRVSHPPRCVRPAVGECDPRPRHRAATQRKSPLSLAVKPQLSLAQRRKRGGLNELDSGVRQVSGAASLRLNLSGATDGGAEKLVNFLS